MITLEFSGVCKNCQFMDMHMDYPHEVFASVKCSHEEACMRILKKYENYTDERNKTKNENDC